MMNGKFGNVSSQFPVTMASKKNITAQVNMWPLKKTYRRTLIAFQRDFGQNLILRKRLIVSIGNRFGKPWAFMAYQNTRFGSSKTYILPTAWDNSWINWRQLRVRHCSRPATKVRFPAHVCYLQPFNGHHPNGGRNAMVLAGASNTERFLYWICALVMISLSLQKCVKKSAGY